MASGLEKCLSTPALPKGELRSSKAQFALNCLVIPSETNSAHWPPRSPTYDPSRSGFQGEEGIISYDKKSFKVHQIVAIKQVFCSKFEPITLLTN